LPASGGLEIKRVILFSAKARPDGPKKKKSKKLLALKKKKSKKLLALKKKKSKKLLALSNIPFPQASKHWGGRPNGAAAPCEQEKATILFLFWFFFNSFKSPPLKEKKPKKKHSPNGEKGFLFRLRRNVPLFISLAKKKSATRLRRF